MLPALAYHSELVNRSLRLAVAVRGIPPRNSREELPGRAERNSLKAYADTRTGIPVKAEDKSNSRTTETPVKLRRKRVHYRGAPVLGASRLFGVGGLDGPSRARSKVCRGRSQPLNRAEALGRCG